MGRDACCHQPASGAHVPSTVRRRRSFEPAKVIKQPGPSIVHIKGTSTMFSSYEFDRNVLAFYSAMEPAKLAVFDTPAKDAGMKHIVAKLQDLVDALMKVVYGGAA